MLRYILVALAGLVLLTVTLIPEDAYARRGGGGGFRGGGGFHGGGMRAGGFHGGGARFAGRGVGYRGGVGRYAGRGYGYRRAGYYGGRYYRPGAGVAVGLGAAAVGAAAAGAYGAYGYGGGGCYTNSYGSWVCPGQYGYGY